MFRSNYRHVHCEKSESLRGISLGPNAKIEWHQRHPDANHPFLVKRMSWSWFSAETVRIQPTELEFRVKGEANYLALHDFVRSDGETRVNGGSRSTITDARDRLTFVPIGSSVEGWNCLKSRVSLCGSSRPFHVRSLRKRYLGYPSITVF
jgi:hypothetical protein